MNAYADFATPRADRYLSALCHHFGRKLPVDIEAGIGRITFAFGGCVLTAHPDRLRLALTANDEADLARLAKVVSDHLERFAFREHPDIVWHREQTAA